MARTSVSRQLFVTVRTEGGLLPPDLLARIAASDGALGGLGPEDYGLARGERLNEAASRAWANIRTYWAAFKATTSSLGKGESGVSETREQWLLPLFRELGYGRLVFRGTAEEVDGKRYAISHQAGEGRGVEAPPIHTVSCRQDIERPTTAGMGGGGTGPLGHVAGPLRVSPYGLLQEYLNRTDHVWGVVTNGLRLRLVRDNLSLTRAAFVEFDLEAMLEGGVYADFVLLFLLLHRSRLPGPGRDGVSCWLERWRLASEVAGTRALDELRKGVEAALKALGQGLLEHPENDILRRKLVSGVLSVTDYYRQLLRLVYRLLFLLAAEERDLLFDATVAPGVVGIYARHYGVGRLRTLIERRRSADGHDDLWCSLSITFAVLRDEATGAALGLKPLAGGLFGASACPDLDRALVGNARLLEAIRGLSVVKDPQSGVTRRVNYRDMGVEELGSVYEGLLELQPVLKTAGDRPVFDLGFSGERKSTGSYYTNDGLVRELIASALDPVIEAALRRGRTIPEQRANLLALTVCDPACGSGHFLLAAARRIGREVARLDAGDTEPDPEEIRAGGREAIGHCIYGVDHNALAVDLCKLALWLEGHMRGKPLGFLDHRIKHGNSLVGATRALVEAGVPDEAFEPVTGDDKKFAAAVKKRNKREHLNAVLPLWFPPVDPKTQMDYLEMLRASDDSLSIVAAKEQAYREHQGSRALLQDRLAFNLWTAAFFWPLKADKPEAPTHAYARQIATDPSMSEQVVAWAGNPNLGHPAFETALRACQLADQHAFFHWELEFEEVFGGSDPGFDCILGNPPWDQIQLDPREFFAIRAPEIADAKHMTARNTAIAALPSSHPALYGEYVQEVAAVENFQCFIHGSGRFPKTSYGRLNTAPLFAELVRSVLDQHGRIGLIVPTGIATDSFNQFFFQDLMTSRALVSLHSFENEELLFPGIHHATKFCLLTLTGITNAQVAADFVFFARQTAHLRDEFRHITLTAEDFALLNPNTRTCPIFRSGPDAALTKAVYRRVPVLMDEAAGEDGDPWGFRGLLMFMMNTASKLFRSREQLEIEGWQLEGNVFRRGDEQYLPLYEGKMIHQFDHRFGTYFGQTRAQANQGKLPELTVEEHANPHMFALPEYWVPKHEVDRQLAGKWDTSWFLGWRDVTSSVSLRTVLPVILPRVGCGHTLPLLLPTKVRPSAAALMLANLASIVFDFISRQKIGGNHLTYHILKQLPVLTPETYLAACPWSEGESLQSWLEPRVLELTYTAWDLQPFARELGFDGPPFVWDEGRRSILKADLDAAFAHLYGLSYDDFAYVLDTFPLVRDREISRWHEYRTKLLCLTAYKRLANEDQHSLARVQRAEFVPDQALMAAEISQSTELNQMPTIDPQWQGEQAAIVTPEPLATHITGADRYRQVAVLTWAASGGRGDFNFGRLKLVKELYFLQEHLGVDLKFDFVREAAGPLDPAVYKVENLAVKQQWIQVFGKRGERASYQQGRQGRQALQVAQAALGKHAAEAEALHAFFRPFDTLKMEQWATVHQVWRDRSLREAPVTREAIVADVLAWKPDKRGFDRDAVERTLSDMEEAAMVRVHA